VGDSAWSGRGWEVAVTDTHLAVVARGRRITVSGADAGQVALERRWWRWQLGLKDGSAVRLPGLGRDDAAAIQVALRRLRLAPELVAAVAWTRRATDQLAEAEKSRRWFTTEQTVRLLAARPMQRLGERIREAGLSVLLSDEERLAVQLVDSDLEQAVAHVNERIAQSELEACKDFFATVEKSPLTDEQARAVVTFDNRVQLLAAAG
jgi:DNA helicase IV